MAHFTNHTQGWVPPHQVTHNLHRMHQTGDAKGLVNQALMNPGPLSNTTVLQLFLFLQRSFLQKPNFIYIHLQIN